jgi:hypothetical protein
MKIAGGAAWFLAAYAGPVVALVRSPFQRHTNIALGFAYLVLLCVLAYVNAQAVHVEAAGAGDVPGLIYSVLREFVQPFRW